MRSTRSEVKRHPAPARPAPFSTRRRLILAFSVVFGAFALASAAQIFTLRRMEATFARVEQREQEMELALEVEDAVRDQFDVGSSVLTGTPLHGGGYRGARARTLGLIEALGRQMDEPPVATLAQEIVRAAAELDRAMEDVERGALGPDELPAALRSGYAVVLSVEERVDSIFRLLQRETRSAHRELVALEASALRWTAVLLAVTAAFAAGAVLYLSRSVAAPLARLTAGAEALKGGDLDARIQLDTPDEFGTLAAELNEMAAALKEHQRRLVESEKLAGIGRLAAGVAHEINNPLQTILGYLSLNRDLPDRRLAAQLGAVEEEALRCKSIVVGLLALARPDGASPGARGTVDLAEICHDVADKVRVGAAADACPIAVRGTGLAVADGTQVRQAVFNLVKNAVEASGPGGRVEVRVGTRDEHVEVDVRDSGPGVAPEARSRIFEPFYTTKSRGTGLGLAVSLAIARANGGEIALGADGAPGATFTLRLPRLREGRP